MNIGSQNNDIHRGYAKGQDQYRQGILQAVILAKEDIGGKLAAGEKHGNQQINGKETLQLEVLPADRIGKHTHYQQPQERAQHGDRDCDQIGLAKLAAIAEHSIHTVHGPLLREIGKAGGINFRFGSECGNDH